MWCQSKKEGTQIAMSRCRTACRGVANNQVHECDRASDLQKLAWRRLGPDSQRFVECARAFCCSPCQGGGDGEDEDWLSECEGVGGTAN